LAGMGVGNSCPLDDRLCLSHSALVSSLAVDCSSFTRIQKPTTKA
jgi:hypothetical protein